MKFAFVSTLHSAEWGGSEELWRYTALRLKAQGHDVTAWVSYWMREVKQVKELAGQGIRIETHLSSDHKRWRRISDKFLHGGPRAFDRLAQLRPDLVVISQGNNDGGFEWAGVCGKLALPYDLIVHCNSEYWWFGDKLNLAIHAYTAANRVFCVSRANLDLLRRQLGEPLSNAEVVRNPFNVSTDAPPDWPDATESYRMACMARLSVAAKGQDLLLQIMARPEWRERPVELNLYGTGPDEPALRRMADMLRLDRVHFRGYVNDVRSVWAENHVLVLPSRYEGLPLALVEAMWCGRPAVVTDVGGNAELCTDGETGFVASAATENCFADALERAWDRRSGWLQMGKAARKSVEQLVPRDPVAIFCERLKASLIPSPQVAAIF